MSGKHIKVLGIAAGVLILGGVTAFFFLRSADSDVLSADASTARVNLPVNGPRWNGNNTAAPAYTGPAITGIVQTASGAPVAGARVMASTLRSAIWVVMDGPTDGDACGGAAVTGADGRFSVRPDARPRAVFVRSDQGFAFAEIPANASTAPSEPPQLAPLVLQPWGSIDATVGPSVPADGARYECGGDKRFAPLMVYFSIAATPKASSHLVLNQVPPGQISLAMRATGGQPGAHWYYFNVHGNQTMKAEIALPGRKIVAHVKQAVAGIPRRYAYLARTSGGENDNLQAPVDATGTIRFDGVVPADYRMNVQLYVVTGNRLESAGTAQKQITVPPATSMADDKPFDVGEISIDIPEKFAVGKPAPPLSGTDAGGKTISLSSFPGKFVVVAVTNGPDGAGWMDVRDLRAVYDRFADTKLISVLTASTHDSIDAVRKASIDANITWPVLDCGSTSEALPRQYVGLKHSISVIDTKGNILAAQIDSLQAFNMLNAVLKTTSVTKPDGIVIQSEHLSPEEAKSGAAFKRIPNPAADDAGTKATIQVLDGALPDGPNPSACLNDGKMPANEDSRDENFRFAMGVLEGRVRFDMGSVMPIQAIHSYSWHSDTRAPQLYRVYGSDGNGTGFEAEPQTGVDPAAHGWKLIALVDSRPTSGPTGGKYGVRVTRSMGTLGNFRYLLFQMFPTETEDTSGNTFYSEIDVIRQN
jgi:peroxiredoxin